MSATAVIACGALAADVRKIAPGDGWNEVNAARLRDDMSRLLGPGMEASVRAVAEIPPEPSGKRPIIKTIEEPH